MIDRLSIVHISAVRRLTGATILSTFSMNIPESSFGQVKKIEHMVLNDKRSASYYPVVYFIYCVLLRTVHVVQPTMCCTSFYIYFCPLVVIIMITQYLACPFFFFFCYNSGPASYQ